MQQFPEFVANTAFFVDLAISLLALSFMCVLTYATRWLPGKAADYKEPAMNVLPLKHKAATPKEDLPARREFVLPRRAAMEEKAVATVE